MVLILDPTAAGALDSLAQSRLELNQPKAAFATARQQYLIRPATPAPLTTLGFVAWRVGKLATAERALKKTLILAPAAREPSANLANVFSDTGRHREAIQRHRRLLRLDAMDLALWGNLGVALIANNDWRSAADAYRQFARLSHGRPVNHQNNDPFPGLPANPFVKIPLRTAWHRLKFDLEQLSYLRDRGALPVNYDAEILGYQNILANLDDQDRTAISFALSDSDAKTIARVHGRMVHVAETGWEHELALNTEVDWKAAQTAYAMSTPAITVVDQFLDPKALAALRKFCLESTVWFELKGAGYLGAYFREGFNDPLLLTIAEELTEKMPDIFAGHPLRMIWAYTYEQSMVGINPHADFARINVNFWITPDSANLDPETGGLLLYRRPAPASWGFEDYNAAPGTKIKTFLGEDAERPIRVPHRQNRAVIFDSRLFHETDRLHFRAGLENRRINVTMLFGGQ